MALSIFRRIRIFQARGFARFLSLLGRNRTGASWIVRWRSSRLFGPLLRSLLLYQHGFSSYAEATAAASKYSPVGHAHPDNIGMHTNFAGFLRESDYAPLFFMAPYVSKLRKVFDLGGSVGNLFYAYKLELGFADDLQWIVYDLPQQREMGRRLAEQQSERRLSFTDRLSDAAGADLFITSGSLHYFEKPLSDILRELPSLPSRVLVNRTPVSRGDDLFTVQDAKTFMIPCCIHGRQKLIDGMTGLGYKLRAHWPVYELHLWVPDYPDLSNNHYSGFYFERE